MTNQKQLKADELFFVVDGNDRPIAPLPRKLVHGHGVWHRVSHVWIFNDAGQVLCQQRALHKEMNPGFWEPFFGGHLGPGEAYAYGAARETAEELGIKIAQKDLKLWKVYKFHHPTGYNNEFQAIFIVRWNGSPQDLSFDDGEVAQVVWKAAAAVARAVATRGDKDWTRCGYEAQFLKDLGGK
jgi:isopentenyldiphosphate isomerase